MATTNTKTVNTTGVTYDSGANLAQNWIEVTGAGANTYAIEDNTLSSSLKMIGTSGDKVYIEGNFADYQFKQNGKTITFDNGVARTAITLSSMTTKVQVTTTLVFLDGSITLTNKAGGVKVSMNGLDDNGNARSQLLTTKYADVKINADDSNTTAATYFADLPVNDVTTLPLTTSIDTINFAAVVGANTVTSGLQDGTATQTWNTGDSITGNNLTNVSLIGNAGAASIVTVTNVAAINMNLVASSTLNAGQFTNVAAVNVTNGIAAQTLTVSNATLGTTYGVSSARNYGVTLEYAGATGTADTAKLSASGTGNSTTDTTFDVATGNVIEAVTLATSGTNFLTVNGGTGAATITVTGAGTNEVTIGSAATTMTINAAAATGSNIINVGSLLSSADVIIGGSSTTDEVIATLSTGQIIPTITNIEELELTFGASGTFNASGWTGGNELDLTPTGANTATVTNLNQTVTLLGIGESAAITATGTVDIGYATGASSAVTLNVGATSTTSDPAVSSTGALTITGNAGALTINSVGDAANTLGAITADAVSALTIAGVAQNLTTGAVSATGAATVSVNGSLANTAITTLAVDNSLATMNVTSGVGTAAATNVTQGAGSGATSSTYNITSGAHTASIGTIGVTVAANNTGALTQNITSGAAGVTVGVTTFQGGAGTTATANVTYNSTVTGGAAAVSIGNVTATLGAYTSPFHSTLGGNVSITSGTGAITTGNYTFDGLSGSATGKTTTTFTANAAGAGAVGLGTIRTTGGSYAASSATFTGTASNGALTATLIGLTSGITGSTQAISLNANGGDVTVSTVDIASVAGTNTASFVLNAASGNTVTITNLTDTNSVGISTITATGAGDITVNSANTGTFANVSDTVVVATGMTGSLTLNLASSTSAADINISLGNAATGELNTVTTGGGSDIVTGGTGADTISTGAGTDTIVTGNGTNTVTGGLDADTITLGTGTDTVVFTSYATTDAVTSFTAGSSGDVAGFGLADLNTELATATASSAIVNGAGGTVANADAIDFSTVITSAGITLGSTDNIFLTSATTSTAVATAIEASAFATGGAPQDGDGIVVAWIDANADLHISMATLTVSTLAIDTAVISDMVVLTGTYAVADLVAGNFDFLV